MDKKSAMMKPEKKGARPKEMMEQKIRRRTGQRRRSKRQRIRRDGSKNVGIARKRDGRKDGSQKMAICFTEKVRNEPKSKLLNKKLGEGRRKYWVGLVNSALTALYCVRRTTDTLLYAH